MLRTTGKHRRRTSRLTQAVRTAVAAALVGGAAVAVPLLTSSGAVATQSSCANIVTLTNGDFETPVISNGSVNIMPQANIPGWQTTATDGRIELWRGFSGVQPASGIQHAELNANQVSTLYQDVATTGGQVLRWELKHRGRTGVDTMALLIGAPGGTLVQQGPNMLDGTAGWGGYSGTYTVPAGQTSTRFAFKSVASASTDPTIGNFLDAISFGTAACLVTTSAVSAATANVGDLLTYTVTARNDGGNPANLSSIADVLPAGTTYVPGSLKSINGSTTVKPSDAAGDDTGEYDAASRTVRVRIGAGAGAAAGGTLRPGESRTMSYQVQVTAAVAGTTLAQDAVSTYTDPLAGAVRSSTSNTVTTAVQPAADLSVTAALAGGAIVAGSPVSYAVTGSNAGPSAASAVQLTADVPAGLTGVAATSAGGTCTVSGGTARCTYPTVASGAGRTMTVTGSVPAGATPGTQYQLSAAAGAGTFELNSVDNTTSLSYPVTARADLAVTLTPPAAPVAGAMATYRAVVTNHGPSTARAITLANPLPAGASDLSGSVPNGTCDFVAGANTLDCKLPDLAPGAASTVTIALRLPPGGAINNAVSIASSTPDPVIANNNASVSTAGTEIADVGVDLAIPVTTAKPGDLVDYTLTVTNHGPSIARNVSFNTVVPPGVTVLRTPSPICTTSGCTIPGLTPGQTMVITGKARIEANAAAGLGSTSTTVVSPTTDTNAVNDTDTVWLTILLDADLRIDETLTSGAVAGEAMREVITVTNDGPTRAEGLLVRQSVPAGAVVPAVAAGAGQCDFQGTGAAGTITPDGGNFVCTLATLADGDTWQITFTGRIPAGFAGGTYSRTAVLTATSPDPDSTDNTVTASTPVAHVADLALSQTTSTPQVIQSSPVQFQVTIRNHGPSDATNVIVQEQPQSSLAISGGTPSAGSYDDAQRRWQIPVLAPGATATLTLAGVAQTAGSGANTVRVLAADSTDPVSANDTAVSTVTIDPAATSLAVTATATVSPAAHQSAARVGDTVTFGYQVRNTGNVTMSGIAVATGLGGTVTCAQTTLAAGAQTTCAAGSTYRIQQSDVDAGEPVADTVFVSGLAPGTTSPASFGPAVVSVPLAGAAPAVTVTVQPVVTPAAHQSAAEAGDTVTTSYRVVNTGNVTLTTVSVTATRGGPVLCPATPLAVGAQTLCAGQSYPVTQAQVDAGQPLADTATVTVTANGVTATGTAAVPVVAAAPALSVTVRPAAPRSAVAAGDAIGYQYLVVNHGNVTMHDVAVAGTLGGTITCPAGPLAVGASVSCDRAAAHPVTQAHVDAGTPITETATPSGRTPAGAVLTFAAHTAAVPVAHAVPSLTVTVHPAVVPSSHQSAADLGDDITFRYVVTNNGNVTMDQIVVTDSAGQPVTCPVATLAVGASTTCESASVHEVTQLDIDNGQPIGRTASATGAGPGSLTVTTSAPATGSVPLAVGAAALTVTVEPVVAPVARQNAAATGDVITYRYLVTNNGNVTMDQIVVTDGRGGTASCPAGPLAVGGTMTCSSATSYTVAQGDLDAGTPIVETVHAGGWAPGATAATTFGPFTGAVPVAPADGRLGVDVRPSSTGPLAAGDTLGFQFVVTNTGNVTMSSVAVSAAPVAATCPAGPLAVGASMTCTSGTTYQVTAADIDAGQPIAGTATATGRTPGSVTDRSFGPFTAEVPTAAATPALTVTITAAVTPAAHAGAAEAGDTIAYAYLVANTGNVTMSGIAVDAELGGTVTCPQPALAAGASMTCTAAHPHQVSQDDVDAAVPVTETASATGRAPGAAGDATFGPVHAAVPVVATGAALSTTVDAVVAPAARQGAARAGDTVSFRYRVTNTGNVRMHQLAVTDSAGAAVTCPAGVLAVGATLTCTSTLPHEVVQDDVDAGRAIERTATAEALAPGASGATPAAPATGGTGVVAAAGELTLAVTPTLTGPAEAGRQLGFRYLVTNTGNVTMSRIAVRDSRLGAATCPVTVLAVGASATCVSASAYEIRPADIDAGQPLASTATAAGRRPGASTDTTFAPVTTSVPVAGAAPALSVTVRPVVTPAEHAGGAEAGDTIAYEYVVTNTGNVTIDRLAVEDTPVGTATCPVGTLAAGASVTCASPGAGYRVTAADVDAGRPISNSARVTGRPAGASATVGYGPFSAPVPVIQSAPSLTVLIEPVVTPAAHQDAVRAGDRVAYRYLVTNNGNRPMSAIVVTDGTAVSAASVSVARIKAARALGVDCPATTLAVGDTMTCTSAGSRTVTQDDIDAGAALPRSATVAGAPPGGTPQSYGPTRTETPVVPAAPDLTVAVHPRVSPAARQDAALVGDKVTYRYVVVNNGNVTMRDVAVVDAHGVTVMCPSATLPVGEEMTCTAPGTYTVTQADVDSGEALRRTASAVGSRPGTSTPATFAPATAAVPLDPPAPNLTARQNVSWQDMDGNGMLSAADVITSTLTVVNTGNVTLTGLIVAGLPAGVTCTPTTLAPGATATCVSEPYRLTAGQIAEGVHRTIATVTGAAPAGPQVEKEAPAAIVAPTPVNATSAPTAAPAPTSPASSAPADVALPVTGGNLTGVLLGGAGAIAIGLLMLLAAAQRRRGAHRRI